MSNRVIICETSEIIANGLADIIDGMAEESYLRADQNSVLLSVRSQSTDPDTLCAAHDHDCVADTDPCGALAVLLAELVRKVCGKHLPLDVEGCVGLVVPLYSCFAAYHILTPHTMTLAVAEIRGHLSAASLATGPLMSVPLVSPSSVVMTAALSSK